MVRPGLFRPTPSSLSLLITAASGNLHLIFVPVTAPSLVSLHGGSAGLLCQSRLLSTAPDYRVGAQERPQTPFITSLTGVTAQGLEHPRGSRPPHLSDFNTAHFLPAPQKTPRARESPANSTWEQSPWRSERWAQWRGESLAPRRGCASVTGDPRAGPGLAEPPAGVRGQRVFRECQPPAPRHTGPGPGQVCSIEGCRCHSQPRAAQE